jgi:hypothetical protein
VINKNFFYEVSLKNKMRAGSKESKLYPANEEQQQKLNLCSVSIRLSLAKL